MQREGKHFLSHAGIYLLARGLPGIVAFLAIPIFSHLLEPADYGHYALVAATVSVLNALLFQWLRLSLIRYMPAYKGDPATLKSTLATAALLQIGALGILALVLSALPISHSIRPYIIPCWLLLAVQALFETACEYSRAVIKPWRVMAFQLWRSLAFIGLGATLVATGWSWFGPLAGMSVGMFVAILLAWREDWKGVKLKIHRPTLAKVTQYGVPLSMTVALTIVIASSDRFLIERYLGPAAAGVYSAASDFTSQTLTLLMMVINMAIYPLALRAWENEGKEAAQEQMRSNASLLMAVGVPCVVGLALLSPGIAQCFFGRSFRSAAVDVIPLVSVGAFVAGFKAFHFDAAFQFVHRTIYQVWIVLFVAIVNIGLNAVAIPLWGINGSAVATLLAYVLSIGLTIGYGRRHLSLPIPLKAAGQVLLAGGVMGVLLFPFRLHTSPLAVGVQIAGGGVVYVVVLVAGNFLGIREAIQARLSQRSVVDLSDESAAVPQPELVEVR